ncbi:protein VASCULATURE COMPLEXITY AND CONNECTIVITY [Rutidosis leptorrhynchoides]|uniref:protein VASCULATURE COMPLEXITY AND CONNECTIVITY n=1 Tax=Rutidosis leptorrhynchoides TaxID=125765 RepID=UPI003A9929A5
MVKLGGALVCLLVVAMDVAAGILAIQAETEQNKVKHLRLWIFECRDPSHTAVKLGLGAAALLAIGHVLTNLLGGCSCVCSQDEFARSSPNRQLSLACLLFTWVILAIGLGMLVVGIMWNNKSRASCGFSQHHLLSIGGILCFVHALFCVAYYVSSSAAQTEEQGKHGV